MTFGTQDLRYPLSSISTMLEKIFQLCLSNGFRPVRREWNRNAKENLLNCPSQLMEIYAVGT